MLHRRSLPLGCCKILCRFIFHRYLTNQNCRKPGLRDASRASIVLSLGGTKIRLDRQISAFASNKPFQRRFFVDIVNHDNGIVHSERHVQITSGCSNSNHNTSLLDNGSPSNFIPTSGVTTPSLPLDHRRQVVCHRRANVQVR